MELERTLPRLTDLSSKERKSVEKMAGAIVSRILHDPMIFLKSESCKDQLEMKVDLFRSVFGLEKNSDSDNE